MAQIARGDELTPHVFREQTWTLICDRLNLETVSETDDRHRRFRDYRGLADLCGISALTMLQIHRQSHKGGPTRKVVEIWQENYPEQCTINLFLNYLEQIQRWDVVDKVTELIREDIRIFETYGQAVAQNKNKADADKYVLTGDDMIRLNQGLDLQNYDAFVLFADDDIDFATELIDNMEKNYQMRFCVKDRDLVGGGFEHDILRKLIVERCNRLIVIVSDAFFSSHLNKFLYSFAEALGLEERKNKVLPCLYKMCSSIPMELRYYYLLDHRRLKGLFWDRLRDSLTPPNQKALETLALSRSRSAATPNHCRKSNLPPEDDTNQLRPLQHHVKFCSESSLPTLDNSTTGNNTSIVTSENDHALTESASVSCLKNVPSSSSDKISSGTKKNNWLLRKLLPKTSHNESSGSEEKSSVSKVKKRFLSRKTKTAALAT